ncbi:hypothetical protein J7J08_09205 [Stenotrophomonas sp. ISL-67]|uniref:hypothetical protein n=1 Tax=Stenotrophomonas sp. ISL-67 TaxID=2819171 RepID=UPI001BE95117|nr:hypothetical protein [Stenotrophomonas sp. ISL-67]MBT2767816.1 hypothetical protein [Stenotrophomonas sp. ISL-67]
MTKPVLVRAKVDEALRSGFRLAAARAHVRPARVLRLLMEEYVLAQGGHPAVCRPLDEHTFARVAQAVVTKVPPTVQIVARVERWLPKPPGSYSRH